MAGRIGHYVGNKRVAGTSGRQGDVTNPATGEVTAMVALASAAEIDDVERRPAFGVEQGRARDLPIELGKKAPRVLREIGRFLGAAGEIDADGIHHGPDHIGRDEPRRSRRTRRRAEQSAVR